MVLWVKSSFLAVTLTSKYERKHGEILPTRKFLLIIPKAAAPLLLCSGTGVETRDCQALLSLVLPWKACCGAMS